MASFEATTYLKKTKFTLSPCADRKELITEDLSGRKPTLKQNVSDFW
jgi:hypothetical protein